MLDHLRDHIRRTLHPDNRAELWTDAIVFTVYAGLALWLAAAIIKAAFDQATLQGY